MEMSKLLGVSNGNLYFNLNNDMEFLNLFSNNLFTLSNESIVQLLDILKQYHNYNFKNMEESPNVLFVNSYCFHDEITKESLEIIILNVFSSGIVQLKKVNENRILLNKFIIEEIDVPHIVHFIESNVYKQIA